MKRRALVLLLLLPLPFFACTPEPPTARGAAGAPAEETATTSDPVVLAQALISQAYGETGESSHVTAVVLHKGLLRVTLDLPINSMGDADVYSRLCNHLAQLITTPEAPTEVIGIQTFAAGNRPVVATSSPHSRCSTFHL